MAIRLESDDSGFEALSGLPARPSYDSFRDKPGVKYLVGGRLDRASSDSLLEEQMHYLKEGNAFIWKREVRRGQEAERNESPFRIHWAVINGDVHWYRF